jgi:CHAT domain-containing protein/tetratricopeptide (TPR) repeat protein
VPPPPVPLTPAQRQALAELQSAGLRVARLFETGKPRQALAEGPRLVALLQQAGKQHDKDFLMVLVALAEASFAQGEQARARDYYRQAAAAGRAYFGARHPSLAALLNNTAARCHALGENAEARRHAEQALEILREVVGERHLFCASVLNNLGAIHQGLGDLGRAESLFRRAQAIRKELVGTRHPEYANNLNNLANLYLFQGDYARAEPLLVEARKVFQKGHDRNNPDHAAVLYNLGALYWHIGRPARAEPLLREALALHKATKGERHPDVALTLGSLGQVHAELGQAGPAEKSFRQSLEAFDRAGVPRHPWRGISLNGLAGLYRAQGKLDRAESLYRQALAQLGATLGQDHFYCAGVRGNLANLYVRRGDLVRAEDLARQASAGIRRAVGEDHPYHALSLDNLAEVLIGRGRPDEALPLLERSRRIFRRHAERVLPALSEAEQLAFLVAEDAYSFHLALSLGLQRRHDPRTAACSAGWALNGKALTARVLAERTLLARDSSGEARQVLDRLLGVRALLARLTLADPTSPSAGRALARLAAQEEDLSKELARLGGPRRGDPWVELDMVRAALPSTAVLVEIVKVRPRGKGEGWEAPRYVAWLIPPRTAGAVRVIDLGAAGTVDAAVAAVRQVFRAAPGDIQAWIISPDGALWLVPWEALPLADGRYAVERHAIRYVVSGRHLARPAAPPAPGRALILADPDFDLDETEARAELGRLVATEPALRSAVPSRDAAGLRWARLAGTAEEAKRVAPLLRRYTGRPATVYTRKQALEGVVKAARRPRVLVLCTHGLFLEGQEVRPAPPSWSGRGIFIAPGARPPPASGRAGRSAENPLLRCGLVLAGANRRGEGSSPSGDDGLLTGREIVGTDLRDTELVVLSACETGLGQVRDGEGVAGLRQAFHLAGARTVAATLWKIPDAETVELVSAYFANLSAGWTRAEALRRAELALIRSLRRRHGTAHPLFWAAFTITGESGPGQEGSSEEEPPPVAEPVPEDAGPEVGGGAIWVWAGAAGLGGTVLLLALLVWLLQPKAKNVLS